MDQIAALLSRAGHALLLDCRTGTGTPVPLDPAAAGLTLLVIDTRAGHALGDGRYAERRRACEQAASALGVRSLRDVTDAGQLTALSSDPSLRRLAGHVLAEQRRVLHAADLLRAGHQASLGPLLTASHHSLRDRFRFSWPAGRRGGRGRHRGRRKRRPHDRRRLRRLGHRPRPRQQPPPRSARTSPPASPATTGPPPTSWTRCPPTPPAACANPAWNGVARDGPPHPCWPRQATFAPFSSAVRGRAFWGTPLPSSAIRLFRIPWGGRLGRGNDDREREGIRRDEVAGLDFGPVR